MGARSSKASKVVKSEPYRAPNKALVRAVSQGGRGPCRRAETEVLGNWDLLQQVLLRLVPPKGCSLDVRLQLASVCRLWRDVALTLPVSLCFDTPLTPVQVERLCNGSVPAIRHISWAGHKEDHAQQILASEAFQRTSAGSLHSVAHLPWQDDMAHLATFTKLTSLGLCRGAHISLLDVIRGTMHDTRAIAGLQQLRSLTLRDLAGPQAALDLSHLPTSLEELHLVNTSFPSHPEMVLPAGLHLRVLTATSLGTKCTILPVELLRRSSQAIVRGAEVFLVGKPTGDPQLGDDSVEIAIGHDGMLVVFAFGAPLVQHETSTATFLKQLQDSDLQALRLSTDGDIHLVERSDCRKGLRWKSLEALMPSQFLDGIMGVGDTPARAFQCNVEERRTDGSVKSLCLTRRGTTRQEAEAALTHSTLLQKFLTEELRSLEERARQLEAQLEEYVDS